VPPFIFAILFHSNLNNNYFFDVIWAFSEYLETLALFPLIYVMHSTKDKGVAIDALTSHFVASQCLSRLLSFFFWVSSFHELNSTEGHSYALFPSFVG